MRTSTIYQKSIKSVDGRSILKKGSANKKLGYKVTSRKWGGSRLYSLTLTERETCPVSCHHWEDCYGNNMPFAHRFSVDGLMPKLEQEVAELCAKHKKGVVVRLHVLGDFFSVEYVRFWEMLLTRHANLYVYGYTGREIGTDIGDAIHLLNLTRRDRWVVRFSRNRKSGGMDSGEWYAAEESYDGPSFDCPEQTGRMASCAECGLCWQAPNTVRFLSH